MSISHQVLSESRPLYVAHRFDTPWALGAGYDFPDISLYFSRY